MERRISNAKPGPKSRIEWDPMLRGFGLRFSSAGTCAFILNYRFQRRSRRITIGLAR